VRLRFLLYQARPSKEAAWEISTVACDDPRRYNPSMTALHALILGLVEGISEFLPISSTGHLILTSKLLGLPETEFLKSFEIAIQLGAILAVAVLYWRKLLLNKDTFLKVCAAFLPTAIIGLLVHDFVKEHLLSSAETVLWSLFLGGIFLIVFERRFQSTNQPINQKTELPPQEQEITYGRAIILGLFQSIAIIPGVSRSASTIVGGLLLGLNRKTIVDFSFLLAIPTMAAATGLDLLKSYDQFTPDDAANLGIGFVVSFVVALGSIKWLLRYIKNHDFQAFGIYRIIVALVFGALLWRGMI
jgi:undecaprenyl-diphosphatase